MGAGSDGTIVKCETPPPPGLTFRSTAVMLLRTASGSVKAGDAICCTPVLEKLAVAHLLPIPQIRLRVKNTSPLSPVRSVPTRRSFFAFHFDIFIPST